MKWAISIAGLVMTSYVQAAEISFVVEPINGMGEKSDIALLHPVNKSRADIFRTGLDIVDVLTNLPSITTETHPDKDTDPVVSTGPLTMRPLAGTEPADQHFLGYLSLDFYSGYLHDSVAYWPATTEEESRPHLVTEHDDFAYSFILESSYVTDYWPEQGQFSWPVSLHLAAFDNNVLTAEVNGAEAFAYLDSTDGHFRLDGQVTTLDGSVITLSFSSALSPGEDVHPELINPLLSIKTGDAAEQLSIPELRLILTGNRHSDIAGQFNNFSNTENISHILTIIGQFSSLSAPRK